MFAGKKSAQIREILISESAWEEMTCLFAPSLSINAKTVSAHKRQIMQKYDLDCDFELLTLLNRMGHQQNMRYLFSERLIFIV